MRRVSDEDAAQAYLRHCGSIRAAAKALGMSRRTVKRRLEYTKSPSAWSHSITVTYRNGKRAIITFYASKWRATP